MKGFFSYMFLLFFESRVKAISLIFCVSLYIPVYSCILLYILVYFYMQSRQV